MEKDSQKELTVKKRSRLFDNCLFASNWLFLILLSKHLLKAPKGSIDFLIKSTGTAIVALVCTSGMLNYLPKKINKFAIPVVLILAISLAFI